MQTLITFLVNGEEFAADGSTVVGMHDVSALADETHTGGDVLRTVETAHPDLPCFDLHGCLDMPFTGLHFGSHLLEIHTDEGSAGFVVDAIKQLLAVEPVKMRYILYQRNLRRGCAEVRHAFYIHTFLQILDFHQIMKEMAQRTESCINEEM